MSYYIDLKAISIDELENIISEADLVKSRMILKESIHENFLRLKDRGIENTENLFNILKNKVKLRELSTESGISEQYLIILIRELKGFRQAPNKLRDFPGLSGDVCSALEKEGIKNSLQLYERVLTAPDRTELAEVTGLSEEKVLYLAGLADLSRIRWVNHTFAYMLMESGYQSASDVAAADINDMHKKVNKINKEKNFYRAQIGLHDMKLTTDSAKFLIQDIKY